MPANPIEWKGQHEFLVVGTTYHEDTLRVESTALDKEPPMLTLTLPTLCITYADMKFANDIGGEQALYPDSGPYGPRYFDPPVSLTGGQIEKLTWIRGASRVTIGRDRTEVQWRMGTPLVIPRLRITPKQPANAVVAVPKVRISVQQPLNIAVKQYADGRHIGGLQIEKRHPDWTAPSEDKHYTLRIRVLEAPALRPEREVPVLVHRWDPRMKSPYGKGAFRRTDRKATDGRGAVELVNRPAGELDAATLDLRGYVAPAQVLRALPGETASLVFRPAPLNRTTIQYEWAASDTSASMSALTGIPAAEIVKPNLQPGQTVLKAGQKINLPCYCAVHLMETGDSFEWLAARFCYEAPQELAERLNLPGVGSLAGLGIVPLPGWLVFYARPGDTLEAIDQKFGVPKGWSRTMGRAYHPEPRLPLQRECVAVPSKSFVHAHKRQ